MVNWLRRFRTQQDSVHSVGASNQTTAGVELEEGKMETTNPVKLPKYKHPKILLLDLNDDVAQALTRRGFNAVKDLHQN